MKTLYLHIGIPKTATSSIQQFCSINNAVMKTYGFCYPPTFRHYRNVNDVCNAHFLIGVIKDKNGVRDTERELLEFGQGLERLHKCFEEFDNIVISDEKIWFSSSYVVTDLWERLKADADAYHYTVKLIIYLRRQDDFLSSRWNQLVKEGVCKDAWDEHASNAPEALSGILNYAAKIDGLAEIFGKENMIIRRFDRNAFHGGDIYHDFFECLGLTITDEYTPYKDDSNLSLKGNTVEVKRVINTAPGFVRAKNAYWRKVVTRCSPASGNNYSYSMFSKEEADAFLSIYREENERIAEEYIGDGLPLFSYDTKDAVKYDKGNPYMAEDVIRVFTITINDLRAETERLKKENADFRQELIQARRDLNAATKHLRKAENELHTTQKQLTDTKRRLEQTNADLKKTNNRLLHLIDCLKHPLRAIWRKLFGGSHKENN
jgi:hypothetical protein